MAGKHNTALRNSLFAGDPRDYTLLVYAVVLVWGVGDTLSTIIAFWGPTGTEANPLIAELLAISPWAFLLFKLSIAPLILIALISLEPWMKQAPGWDVYLISLTLAFSTIVVNNIVISLSLHSVPLFPL